MNRKTVGELIGLHELETIHSTSVQLPHPQYLTHLQFRRFAGCPICNLHIHSFIQRHDELLAHGIQEIAVFHSSKEAMLQHTVSAPFALIADPGKTLFAEFGVGQSLLSVLHPHSWRSALQGLHKHGVSLPAVGETPLGLPADFLIGTDGRLLALKYGRHAHDQWTVDEVIELSGLSSSRDIETEVV